MSKTTGFKNEQTNSAKLFIHRSFTMYNLFLSLNNVSICVTFGTRLAIDLRSSFSW